MNVCWYHVRNCKTWFSIHLFHFLVNRKSLDHLNIFFKLTQTQRSRLVWLHVHVVRFLSGGRFISGPPEENSFKGLLGGDSILVKVSYLTFVWFLSVWISKRSAGSFIHLAQTSTYPHGWTDKNTNLAFWHTCKINILALHLNTNNCWILSDYLRSSIFFYCHSGHILNNAVYCRSFPMTFNILVAAVMLAC